MGKPETLKTHGEPPRGIAVFAYDSTGSRRAAVDGDVGQDAEIAGTNLRASELA